MKEAKDKDAGHGETDHGSKVGDQHKTDHAHTEGTPDAGVR